MDVEDFVDRLGTLGDDLVAHLEHASGAAAFLQGLGIQKTEQYFSLPSLLFLRIRPAALPGCAFGVVVRFAGETGFDAEVMVLDLLVREFVRAKGNAIVHQIIVGLVRRLLVCFIYSHLFLPRCIVAAAAVLHHGRVAGRNLCDAISGLLAAQRSTPLPQLSRKTLASSTPITGRDVFEIPEGEQFLAVDEDRRILRVLFAAFGFSANQRTLADPADFRLRRVEGLAFRIPAPDRFRPFRSVRSKNTSCVHAKPLSSLYRAEVASVVSASHPLRRVCTLGISCDGSSSAD